MATTETAITAIIFNTSDSGDSDVYLDLLTPELGRIGTTSRGAKHLKSRLRYSLEPYSVISGIVIKTKSGRWQLINAELERNLYYETDNLDQKILVRLFELLRRILPTEDTNLVIINLFDLISQNTKVALDRYLYVAAFMLSYLGYLDLAELHELAEFSRDTTRTFKGFVYNSPPDLSEDSVLALKKIIQQALRNSQL